MYKRRQNHASYYRFYIPTFWTGMASVLSLSGVFMPTLSDLHGSARSVAEVDARALAHDWQMIGQDCWTVLNGIEKESPSPTPST